MARRRKTLLIAGIVLLALSAALLGYACYDEAEARGRVHGPEGVDYGFIPLDLLIGRTHYEMRRGGEKVFDLDMGPNADARIAIARAAFGVGLLGGGLLAARAFLKESRRDAEPRRPASATSTREGVRWVSASAPSAGGSTR